jgi:hypothetical protein
MEERNDYYVYTHSRPDNGQVYWVGKGSKTEYSYGAKYDRATDFRNRSESWKAVMMMTGDPIVEYPYTNLTEEQALKAERDLILTIGIENLCNSYIGMEKPEEWKESRTGIPRSKETKEKLRDINLGKPNKSKRFPRVNSYKVQRYSLDGLFEKEYSHIKLVEIDGFNFRAVSNCLKDGRNKSGNKVWKVV